MAINPMQRKARTSFLLGMVITLLITGVIIAFLFLTLINMIKERNADKREEVNVYVLTQDVKSGGVILFDPEGEGDSMIEVRTVDKSAVPESATKNDEYIKDWTLQDKEGNRVFIRKNENKDNSNSGNNNSNQNNNANENETQNKAREGYTLYIKRDGVDYEIKTEENTGEYYIEKQNNEKEYLQLTSAPMVAKIDMAKGTVLTPEAIAIGDNTVQKDMRKQEYNVVVMPTDIETGDIVDIRLRFPNGQDFVVVSKKEVEIPVVDGMDSPDTFWVNLSEDEILTMSSAIIENAQVIGSMLYLNRYTDPGLQEAAQVNYVPKPEVINELQADGNLLEKAKSELWQRYIAVDGNNNYTGRLNENSELLRGQIDSQVRNQDDPQANVQESVEASITNSKSTRQKYIESLAAPLGDED